MNNEFGTTHCDLMDDILRSPFTEVNKRTGHEIKMLPGGTSFRLNLGDQLVPLTGTRKLFPHIAAAEQAWFIKADQDITWFRQYSKAWDKFTEKDGKTVEANYGYRWRDHFRRDQLAEAIIALKDDPTDRRVWVQAWDPNFDGLGAKGQKNVPCPVGFTFSVVGNALHSSIFIRSSDVFVGLPYDVMGHAMLMGVVAASIGLAGCGSMHVTLAHPHLYDSHYDMARRCIEGKTDTFVGGDLPILGTPIDQLELDPDGFVWAYRKRARELEWPSFNPSPEIIP